VATSRPPAGPQLVFVDDLGAPVLDDATAHHVGRVLRCRPGAELTLADGAGAWRAARYEGGAAVLATGEVVHEPVPAPLITVAFALTKGDKPELVVQKLTELGADRIIGFAAARSVVQWDDAKAARNVERWRAVAREAAQQCRRARLPVIEPVTTFAELVGRAGASLAAPGGDPPSLATPLVLVGPEGGWTAEELAAPIGRVALGDHVLRAETAAIAACSVLGALRSRLTAEMSRPAGS
jgi:16S rRNA (uracil1498-N3)-methyltransferase